MTAPTLSTNQVISSLYTAAFARAPDQSGLTYWNTQIPPGTPAGDVGTIISTLSPAFAANIVFTTNYGALSPLNFVNSLYQNVLGGPGDAAGVNYWTNLLLPVSLGGGGQTQAQVLNSFVVASLSWDRTQGSLTTAEWTAALARQDTFVNKANVGLNFEGLGSASNLTTTGTDYTSITTDPAYVASNKILQSITSSIATVTAANDVIYNANLLNTNPPTTNAAVVASVTTNAPPPVPGTTFTLTTGADTFSGHGTFSAADVAGAQTWTAADTLTGTGNNNVFNVVTGLGIAANPAGSSVTGIQTANITSGSTIGTTTALNTTAWTGLTALNLTAVGALTATAAATTAVTATETTLGVATITLNGGSSVTVNSTTTATGAVTIGNTTAPTGAVIVNHTVAGTGTAAGGAITITGGTTVNVTEVLTQATKGFTTTGSLVNVTGTATTTGVTVTQTTPVALVAAATNTVASVAFNSLAVGQSVTVAGLTFTATLATIAAQVATAFASLASGATSGAGTGTGSYSGTFSGFTTSAASTNAIVATATTTGVVAAPVVASSAATVLPSVVATIVGAAQNAGIAGGVVTITDVNATSSTAAGTINTVTLSGFGTTASNTISDNALATLSLSNSAGTVALTQSLATPTVTTLA